MTAVSLGSSIACISKVSINAAGVSIIGKFRCPGVSYDIGRSPFSLSKILLKKIVLSFSPFGNPFLELVGVGALVVALPCALPHYPYNHIIPVSTFIDPTVWVQVLVYC